MKNYISQTIDFVKKELQNNESAHDWHHINRVYHNTLHILQSEQANEKICLLAALLHDIADSKFYNGDETIGPKKARDFMSSIGVEDHIKKQVVLIIENISFKGGNFEKTYHSKELEIVQDADRLDAIGAIGIARTFNYGGYKNNAIYDPEIPPKMNMTKEEYKKHQGTTINHFYEKLLLLKDLMNTETAKKIAQKRHNYMQDFLEEFFEEWKGNR